mmetsp:Transcript_39926/g.78978  ORF Transcript_39926/g.78978 Transcript_39926/m.78978 type:complete len:81 (-) Transcript_39926:618-860(-)
MQDQLTLQNSSSTHSKEDHPNERAGMTAAAVAANACCSGRAVLTFSGEYANGKNNASLAPHLPRLARHALDSTGIYHSLP